MYLNFHLISPIIYILYVFFLQKITPKPKSHVIKFLRKIHNIVLSILSAVMFIGISYETYKMNKFNSIYELLCKNYDETYSISTNLFLYSKYLEWGDTLFLHLGNKPISMLHYTHHMSTSILMYLNLEKYISPFIFISISLNTFIHVFMYWYFAYPKGFLYKYRKMITKFQIIQHFIVVISVIQVTFLSNCQQNRFGKEAGLILYLMYLLFFSHFYLMTYVKETKKVK